MNLTVEIPNDIVSRLIRIGWGLIKMFDMNTISAASGAIVVPVTALLLNYRGFASIDSRFGSLERRVEVIEKDLKDFYKTAAEHDREIARLKDHTGLK